MRYHFRRAIHPDIFHPQDDITTIPLPGGWNKIFHPLFPPLFPPQLYHYLTLCERGKIAELWISFGTLVSLMCLTPIYSYSCLTLRYREGATLTAIGIDRFSAVWPREEIGQGHFYLQREAENILRGLSRWIGQTHKQAQMPD